jgi:protein-S-isoprenylcysteine O-methyltransferase Ste14
MKPSISKALERQARKELMTRHTKLRVLLTLLPFRMVVAFVVAASGPYSILTAHPGRPFADPALLTSAGVLLMGAGAFVYIWCAWDFAFTGLSFWPSMLVERGIYGRLRHPMYLSLILFLLGESLLFKSWRMLGYASVFAAGVQVLVIFYEEPRMVGKWGAAYLEYCRKVPRWIPRVRHRLTC